MSFPKLPTWKVPHIRLNSSCCVHILVLSRSDDELFDTISRLSSELLFPLSEDSKTKNNQIVLRCSNASSLAWKRRFHEHHNQRKLQEHNSKNTSATIIITDPVTWKDEEEISTFGNYRVLIVGTTQLSEVTGFYKSFDYNIVLKFGTHNNQDQLWNDHFYAYWTFPQWEATSENFGRLLIQNTNKSNALVCDVRKRMLLNWSHFRSEKYIDNKRELSKSEKIVDNFKIPKYIKKPNMLTHSTVSNNLSLEVTEKRTDEKLSDQIPVNILASIPPTIPEEPPLCSSKNISETNPVEEEKPSESVNISVETQTSPPGEEKKIDNSSPESWTSYLYSFVTYWLY